MQHAISLLSAILYFISSFLIAKNMRASLHNEAPVSTRWLLLSWVSALAIHALSLSTLVFIDHGMDLGIFRALSTVGWLTAGLLLATCFGRASISIGLIVLPLAGISSVVGSTLPEVSFITEGGNKGLEIHIFISLLAYSMLTLATLQALLLSYQSNHLHNHHPGGVLRILPPLQEMEHLLFQLLTAGFLLLSVGLITGFIFLDNIFAQHLVHKTVLSIVAWFAYGILIWGHLQFGWRGKLAVRYTVIGFVLLMLAYFGSKVVLELLLQHP
jgi:ABC-type uncharacterized transport system permease subunit